MLLRPRTSRTTSPRGARVRGIGAFFGGAMLMAAGCASTPSSSSKGDGLTAPPLPVHVHPPDPKDAALSASATPVLLRGAKIYTLAGATLGRGHVLIKDGVIVAVGEGEGDAGDDVTVIDVDGGIVTPGIIDTHSHMGVYPLPGATAHNDGNELSSPSTAEVWAEHSFWPQDPALPRALMGGVTTIQVLPGSANLFGGRSFTAKLTPGKTSARDMRFPGAPQGLKMACGENPKRNYGSKGRAPSTRMGNVAGYREAFQKAHDYRRRWEKYDRDFAFWTAKRDNVSSDADKAKVGDPPDPPPRDLALESLVGVMNGEILVHNHCYRADEMHIMLDLADQYGFQIRSFHHALEAYKLRHRLAESGTASSTWADWWGFKLEAYDGIPYNAALLEDAGARVIIHSDSSSETRRLNQEAAKALARGRELGLKISDETALAWITKNPAWALGVDDKVGTLEVGKMADIVVWDNEPLSVYARPAVVLIDGVVVVDKARGVYPSVDLDVGVTTPMSVSAQPVSDENEEAKETANQNGEQSLNVNTNVNPKENTNVKTKENTKVNASSTTGKVTK